MKAFAIGLFLAASLAAAWFFFNGGVSHWQLERTLARHSAELGGKVEAVDRRAGDIESRLGDMDAKLDRIEAKIDSILDLAARPLPDHLQ